MRRLRFGIAGIRDLTDLRGSISSLADAGFTACEVQFVKEFTLKESQCAELGVIARDHGVALSVHAPYFAQLTTNDADRAKQHLGALHHASKLAAQMGATIVVCHPGSRGDAEPEELVETVHRNLETLGPRIADTGVRLGLETCGRRSQFGTLGDIAMVVRDHPFTAPVIDFAHIHALSNGSLQSPEAFRAVFEFIADNFSDHQLAPLHCHFTDNRFGEAGEISHVPYGEGTVRASNLVEGAKGFDLSITMISEEKWAESHTKILEELRASGAPLQPPKGGPEPDAKEGPGAPAWLPDPLPLQESKGVHFFRRGPREVRITNIDKPLFPDDGYTKGDLAAYYYNVAPLMVPFLKDRPIVMQRVPEGIHGEAFYEKQAPRGRPDWVRTTPVPSDGGTKNIDYVVVDDAATLVWLAQIGSVECHAWTSRLPDLESPDYAVIDLDPHEPVTFEDVKAVAKLVKVVLDRFDLKGFPKTSGGAGIQVFIPIARHHTYPQVRDFCASLGRVIRQVYPEKVTLEPSKPKRAGKVFIDANQNSKGKTLVAPYSVRPYPGAPVSAPLTWEDIDTDIVPEQFTISTIFERIEQVGDPFRGALGLAQDLLPALEQLDED